MPGRQFCGGPVPHPRAHTRKVDCAAVNWNRLFSGTQIRSTRELLHAGASPRALTLAVRSAALVRVRRGHYALPGTDRKLLEAVRIGGVLGCVSAAERLGIWVPDDLFTHVLLGHSASRLRSPRNRFLGLTFDNRDGCSLHWSPTLDSHDHASVGVIDALAQIVRCQPRHLAVAALDSALNQGLIDERAVRRIFKAVPRRFAGLSDDLDGRSQSGLETLVRLLVRDASLACELQVHFEGIGHVDLVVEGCVVVETDGHKNHDGAREKRRDYARDAALAALGYIVLRFNYRQVVHEPEVVMRAIRGALLAHRAMS